MKRLNWLLDSIKRLFGGRNNTTDQQPALIEGSEDQEVDYVVDVKVLTDGVGRHRERIGHTVDTVRKDSDPADVPLFVTNVATQAISALARVYARWETNSLEGIKPRIIRTLKELKLWETDGEIAKKFEGEIEQQNAVLESSCKLVFEQKTRSSLRTNQIGTELAQVKNDRRNLLIRLTGDENGHLKAVNFMVYGFVNVMFFVLLSVIEAVLGMPIFRYESSGPFAYMMSMAFAWVSGGFVYVGASHVKKYLANKHAWRTYRHVYDENDPPQENSRVIKPDISNLQHAILGFGATAVVVIIAFILLGWRLYVAQGMDSDGGISSISALLLVAVLGIMYAAEMMTGPQHAKSEYQRLDVLNKKEASLREELKSLQEDDSYLDQIHEAIRAYKEEVQFSASQIHSDAKWLRQECTELRQQIMTIMDQRDRIEGFVKEDLELINAILQKSEYKVDPSTLKAELATDKWTTEMLKQLVPLEKPTDELDRFEKFKPNYELSYDKMLVNFQDLLESTEKESREKVLRQLEEEKISDGNHIVPLF